jgi:uncharacterized protein
MARVPRENEFSDASQPDEIIPADAAREEEPAAPDTTGEDRAWASAAYLVTLAAPILGPLCIYFVKKDQSRFAAFHALQSLFLALAWIVVSTVAVALAFTLNLVPFAGWIMARQLILAPWLMGVAVLIFTIVSAVKAYNGEWFQVPLIGAWAARQTGTAT